MATKDTLGDRMKYRMKNQKKKGEDLGDRMKSFYEDRYRISLPRRTNIVIRIDGKAFHTYTKGLKRPYDEGLLEDMNLTTKFLCESVQGAKLGYVQSDEISIVLHDYNDLSTDAWFDHNLQKMCSISASLATAKFNQLRNDRFATQRGGFMRPPGLAMFDARVFVIPEQEEVVNYLIWRQQDATRNSISMAAQSMFSHKELQGKSSDEMQELMFTLKGVNWNDYPTRFRRGAAVIKVTDHYRRLKGAKTAGEIVPPADVQDMKQAAGILGGQSKYEIYERSSWKAVETPIFSKDRNFVLEVLKPKSKEDESYRS